MKHIFFINQDAGQGNKVEEVIFRIHEIAKKENLDYRVLQTKGEGSAESMAREIAQELRGEEARFYAAGGDGTVNDVVNGMVGYDNLALGIIPLGTGNDTARSIVSLNNKDVVGYSSQEKNEEAKDIALHDFMDIEKLIKGQCHPIDLIRYWGIIDDNMMVRYCINMINIGLDCNVVEYASELKKKPFIKGHGAYLLSVFAMIIKKCGTSLRIEADGEEVYNGPMIMCYIGNGNYCGGGICSSPQGSLKDGKLDLNIVKNITRREFVQVFPSFKKGKHLTHKKKDKLMDIHVCDKIEIYPYEGKEFTYCVDGEITSIDHLSMESSPNAIKIIVPIVEEKTFEEEV